MVVMMVEMAVVKVAAANEKKAESKKPNIRVSRGTSVILIFFFKIVTIILCHFPYI